MCVSEFTYTFPLSAIQDNWSGERTETFSQSRFHPVSIKHSILSAFSMCGFNPGTSLKRTAALTDSDT
jgi:hypothetical protein